MIIMNGQALFGVVQGSSEYTLMTTAISLCSIAGSLGGGYVSDRFCGSQRGPVLLAYGVGQC